MKITRNGSNPTAPVPEGYFTGTVRLDNQFKAEEPARLGGAVVTFEPGARTNWHTHPRGQTLMVLSGLGRVRREGGPVEEMRPGDIVSFAGGERHWHGAAPDVAMSHLAIAEADDEGSSVTWLEAVSDADYSG